MMLVELPSTVLGIFSKFSMELRTACFPKNAQCEASFYISGIQIFKHMNIFCAPRTRNDLPAPSILCFGNTADLSHGILEVKSHSVICHITND